MLPPGFTTRATRGITSSWNRWKSSTVVESSYSLPMQYGGEVRTRSTESSGRLFKRSMQLPSYTTARSILFTAAAAFFEFLYVRTTMWDSSLIVQGYYSVKASADPLVEYALPTAFRHKPAGEAHAVWCNL